MTYNVFGGTLNLNSTMGTTIDFSVVCISVVNCVHCIVLPWFIALTLFVGHRHSVSLRFGGYSFLRQGLPVASLHSSAVKKRLQMPGVCEALQTMPRLTGMTFVL